jgi:hypothetical protein
LAEETIRVELAFDGGQILAAFLTAESADELERALASGDESTHQLEASDGRYSVVLRRVVYLKRYARESRVGFGN